MEGFERVLVYGFSVDLATKQPIVLLKVEDKNRVLPIWIGCPETTAILMKLQRRVLPRPLTHDLLASVIDGLSASLERVLVTGVRENTVYAVLQLVAADEEIDVDSRPSDAIALAVRTDAPIFVSTELLATNGIEFEQQKEDVDEVVKEFKTFLNQVSPEDF
jgi:bifunctional DNase/RNase